MSENKRTMEARIQQQINTIKEICKEIRYQDDVTSQLEKLMKISNGKAYWEAQIVVELLETIHSIVLDDPMKIKTILIFIDGIIQTCSESYTHNINKLYKFVSNFKGSLDLQKMIIEVIKLKDNKIRTSVELSTLLFYIRICFTLPQALKSSSESRSVLIRNLYLVLKNAPEEQKDQLMIIESLQAILKILNKHDTVLGSEFLMALSDIEMNIVTDEVFHGYITFISIACQTNIRASFHFVTKMDASFKTDDMKKANKILKRSIAISSKELICATDLQELRNLYKKNDGSVNIQKVTIFLSKLFAAHQGYEISTLCFAVYYGFVYDLVLVLSKIKSVEGVYTCCSDIKRHEIFYCVVSVFTLARKLIEKENFTLKSLTQLNFYMNYILQISNELNCDWKKKAVYRAFGAVYNTIFEINLKKETLMPVVAKEIESSIKTLLNLYELLAEDDKNTTQNPLPLLESLLGAQFDASQAPSIANSWALIFSFKVRHEKSCNHKERTHMIMKNIFSMRKSALMSGFQSAAQFIVTNNLFKELQMSIDELHALEICVIQRSLTSEEQIEQIAIILQIMCDKENLDMRSFAISCQCTLDSVLKKIDLNKFKELNEKLQKYSDELERSDIEVSLGLALNYYIFFHVANGELREKFQEYASSNDVIKSGKYSKIVDELNFKDEIKLLDMLEKSMKNFTNAVLCLQDDKDARQKIVSDQRIQKIIDNISIVFLVRGIEYKDIEAQNLLWNFFAEDSVTPLILSSATVFLDNHSKLLDSTRNYVKLSKNLQTVKIAEVLRRSIDTYKSIKKTILQGKEKDKVTVINYQLSIWNYYLMNGKMEEAQYWWKEFYDLWNVSGLKETTQYKDTFNAKIFYSAVEVNSKCFKRNATNVLFDCITKIISVRSLNADFYNLFQQIYRRLTTQAINYAINRQTDLDHYRTLMITLKSHALINGYFFRSCKYISLSILRHLNMEKLDLAKIELKEFTSLLGINEDISVESPNKSITVLQFNFEQFGISPRDVSQESSSSPLPISLPQQTTLTDQLKSFIHSKRCQCSNCQYPIIKFYVFQVACHYSRLFWLMDNYEVSRKFNEFALDYWRIACQQIIRSKDCTFLSVSKNDFITFSIRWLFQVADTLIKLEDYDEADTIYTEISIICTAGTPDFECMSQRLYVRKENLEHLSKYRKKKMMELPQLSFEEFLIQRAKRSSKSEIKEIKEPISTPSSSSSSSSLQPPSSARAPRSASAALRTPSSTSKKVSPARKTAVAEKILRPKKQTQKDESVIFIDSSEDEKPKKSAIKTPATTTRARKKPSSTASQPSLTQETPKSSSTARTRRMI